DHPFVTGILLDQLAQLQIAFGDQQFLHQHLAGGEEDPMAFSHQFLAYRLQQVRLAAARISKNKTFSVRSRKPPSSRARICRAAFAGSRRVSNAVSDFSNVNCDSRSILLMRFSCRSSHSRSTSSCK